MNGMKIIGVLVIVLVLALIGFHAIAGHRASWLIGAGGCIAKNQHEADVFEGKLSDWLDANGFTLAEDPGGMLSWAGVHSAGEINRWYRGTYKDSSPFLLRVSTVPRKGGFTEFHFYHAWSVRGTRNHIARMRALSEEFTKTFSAWYQGSRYS